MVTSLEQRQFVSRVAKVESVSLQIKK